MSLGGYERKVATFTIYDPGQDARVNVLKVPTNHTYTIEAAVAVLDRDLAASTANYVEVSLENAGAAGTAQTVIGGTAGGTAGWTGQTPKAISITSGSGDLTAGQYLAVNYAETGAVAPGVLTVIVEYVDGVGANA